MSHLKGGTLHIAMSPIVPWGIGKRCFRPEEGVPLTGPSAPLPAASGLPSSRVSSERCNNIKPEFKMDSIVVVFTHLQKVPQECRLGYTVVGYALYFYTYSTWKGRSVYMEDLYVMPDFRGKGIGTGLMAKVAQVGVEKQCVRLQFSVLEWNKPSLDFYIAKGAEDLTAKEGWHFLRFHGQSLDTLAKEAPKD
ncbi:diamine acetyltransferase 2b isoform X3 [Oncorhynchus nerka]|uniref:diamine acetyltransferase 2b isoform X3 n=1 Tax=Oncorhynchus nerka TaxID=8023 RepID=UPI00112FEC0B|nr:diamine acetyltransferase 2-like isoform X3 [Oncorhynchus nerka]